VNRLFVVGVLFLLISSSVISISGFDTEQSPTIYDGKTLFVGGSGPGNYTKIQDAIDNASDGDTVFVYDESSPYYENIAIKKSINLIGEDKETTEIVEDYESTTISIFSNKVNISGFTIKNSVYWTYTPLCIFIEHAYDCVIYNNNIGPSDFSGINIWGQSGRNLIKGNEFDRSGQGLIIYSSAENNIIVNNTFYKSGPTIESNNNTIISNTFLDSHFDTRGNTIILNNEFFDSTMDIHSNDIIRNNSFVNGGFTLYSAKYPSDISNNTINGKPLAFFVNESDMVIDYPAGQIYLINCTNILIKNQILSNTTYGIVFINTNNCKVYESKIFSNWFDIELHSDRNSNISNNYIANSTIGIRKRFSSNNSIIFNNTITKQCTGIYIDKTSSHNLVFSNNISSNEEEGLAINGPHNIIKNNRIINNGNRYPLFYRLFTQCGGIHLSSASCKNNTISSNIIHSNNNFGIWVSKEYIRYKKGPSNNNIIGNVIYDNKEGGIGFYRSYNNIVTDNDISEHIWGIYLRRSSNNTITSNNFKKNLRHAQFICSYNNKWDSNYWGIPRNSFYPIFGRQGEYLGFLPWVNFDWHPAQEPYDIEV
jgi:parallel beta-helix repeat protein